MTITPLFSVADPECLMWVMHTGENFTLLTILMTTHRKQHDSGICRGFLWLYPNVVPRSKMGSPCIQKGHMGKET